MADLDELYRQNAKIVYHFLYKSCQNVELAQDLTQETFLQAYKAIGRFDGSCKISVWLCQIALTGQKVSRRWAFRHRSNQT